MYARIPASTSFAGPRYSAESFVYVAEGELKTDHSFYLAGRRFLTLHYEIERAAVATRVTYSGHGAGPGAGIDGRPE
jgi:hypothetical protein